MDKPAEIKQPYMLECELSESSNSNLLEAMNLALFNQGNQEVDINLKMTGVSMMILTAGCATYKVNSDIISPTKSRVILSGIPVHMISFSKEPPYQTPLLIKCCEYRNPFSSVPQTKSPNNREVQQQ